MHRSTWIFTISLFTILALSACQSGAQPPGSVMLGKEDNGKTVELSVGDELVIELEGNPTTGYTWETASDDTPSLKQVGEAEYETESDLVGAGGMFTFHFEAMASGQTELRLVYHRPWEEDVDPLETFEVNVVVR